MTRAERIVQALREDGPVRKYRLRRVTHGYCSTCRTYTNWNWTGSEGHCSNCGAMRIRSGSHVFNKVIKGEF